MSTYRDPVRPRRVPRWALPGELAVFDGGRPGRRTGRDWLVDALLFAIAVLGWVVTWRATLISPEPGYLETIPGWMATIDPWVGAAACLPLWWRRRFPLAVAVLMVPVLLVSGTALVAVLISMFTVAVHRGWLPAGAVAAVQTGQAVVWAFMWQPPGLSPLGYAVNNVLLFGAPFGFGLMVRFRRQLIVSLRHEAERERAEHRGRLAQARRAERERIAREMHDVLAHRISLLSVHAGALAYRTAQTEQGKGVALTGSEITDAVQVIRDNAHQALNELGEVLSVLRETDCDPREARGGSQGCGAGGRDAPQPRLSDLPRLVEEARAAGQRVTLDLDPALPGGHRLRPQEQRTVYRVVQEGLTNARKHAPDAQVAIRVAGAPAAGLAVAVTNPLPVGVCAAEIPGAGAGLAGLAERVRLEGGALEHGAVDGSFRLAARLPWQA